MNEPGASIVHHPAETELFADTLTCDVALPASFETGSAATHPNAAEMMLRSIALVEDSRGDDDGERALVEQLASWHGDYPLQSTVATLFNQLTYELARAAMHD